MIEGLNRKYVFATFTALAFVYMGLRAVLVPISHDEAVTYFLYVQGGGFLPHQMIWDANNHLLNSAFMYHICRYLGNDLIWLRLPNVLAFLLYARFAYGLLKELRSPLLWTCASLAMLSPALLLELFAQARGYGLGMACLLGSTYSLLNYAQTGALKAQWMLWAWLALALLANMSMLNSYLITIGWVGFLIFMKWGRETNARHLIAFAVGGLLPFGLFSAYAMAMRERGLLYYGSKEGFVETTITSLNQYIFYSDAVALAWVLSSIAAIAAAALMVRWLSQYPSQPDAGALAAVMLLANAFGAILLCYLMEVNYPEDRTGIYFVPFFILVVAYAIHMMLHKWRSVRWLSPVLLCFPAALLLGANFGYTALWRNLHLDESLYQYLAENLHGNPDERTVEAYRLMMSSWGYLTVINDRKLGPIHPVEFSQGKADFALCHAEACKQYTATHDTLFKDPRNETYLMERRKKLLYGRFGTAAIEAPYAGEGLFVNLFTIDDRAAVSRIQAIDLDLKIKGAPGMKQTELVIAAYGADEERLYYDFIPLNWVRQHWDGEHLKFRRLLNLPKGCTRVSSYLWNIKEGPIEVEVLDVGLLEASDPIRQNE